MKLLICGSRWWSNARPIQAVLKELKPDLVIEGECRGADMLAKWAANKMKITVEEFPADWDKHKKAAGYIRNRKMIEQKPDLVAAFYEYIERSDGTAMMLCLAEDFGIPYFLIDKENGTDA